VTLRSFANLVRTYWILLAVSISVAALTALAASMVLPRTYQASAQLIVGPALSGSITDYNQLLTAQQLSRTYAQAAETTAVADAVIKRLDLDTTPERLLESISAVPNEDTPVVVVGAEAETADGAAAIANAVAEELVSRAATIEGTGDEVRVLIDEQIATVTGQITLVEDELGRLQAIEDPTAADIARQTALSGQLVTLRSTLASLLATKASLTTSTVAVLDRAVPPLAPSAPRPLLNLLVGLALGAVLGLVLAAAHATLDDTMKSGDDVREVLGLPVLGAIGPMPAAGKADPVHRLTMLLYPRSPGAEAFRALRASIEYVGAGSGPIRTLLIASAGAREGKTTVAANLALAFAQSGRRTILVDADLRQPGIGPVFHLQDRAGLSTILRPGARDVDPLLQPTDEPNLLVLGAGPVPPSPADYLGSTRMAELLASLRGRADIVILDSAPVRAAADTAVLARDVDGVVIVVATGETRRAAARATREAFDRVGARVIGVALNRRRPGRDASSEEMESYGYAARGEAAAPGAEGATG
jgi:capsular exopolysaccharide synthesis family protein